MSAQTREQKLYRNAESYKKDLQQLIEDFNFAMLELGRKAILLREMGIYKTLGFSDVRVFWDSEFLGASPSMVRDFAKIYQKMILGWKIPEKKVAKVGYSKLLIILGEAKTKREAVKLLDKALRLPFTDFEREVWKDITANPGHRVRRHRMLNPVKTKIIRRKHYFRHGERYRSEVRAIKPGEEL